MFKFDRIESQQDPTRNMLIDSIVTKMRRTLQKDISLKDLTLATFIITKEAEKGTTGGACLFKKTFINRLTRQSSCPVVKFDF